ncbi:hypothetical protein CJ030_MR6G020070 [Morella rubra]|uniref:Uncharacterized protein n=1 Tax=Morella rubra TaxID=262757 RepID=A0A6A1VAT4_9ROSI|nr:hypothetical protein CJ030_MR6G020070 [Morella rubra]
MQATPPSQQDTPRSFKDDEPLNNDETLDNTRVCKVCGGTRMTEVWNLKEGTRIPTQFNENGQPLDTEGGIFTQFTGCVARVPNQIPLDAVDWCRVPKAIKEDCWTIMTKRFTIPEGPLGDIVKHGSSKIWEKNGGTTNHRSQAGKQSRSLQTSVHAAGTKSFARHAHELEKEKQVIIDRAELYKAVHSRSDGSPMNPDVADKIKRMEEIQMNELTISQPLSQSTMGGSISWSPSDRYAQDKMKAMESKISSLQHTIQMTAKAWEQREDQNVANLNLDQVPPSIPRSSRASRKTFDDNVDGEGEGVSGSVDGAESAGAGKSAEAAKD